MLCTRATEDAEDRVGIGAVDDGGAGGEEVDRYSLSSRGLRFINVTQGEAGGAGDRERY